MKLRGLVDEDYVNYKLPSMFVITSYCSGKCNVDYPEPVCQNYLLEKNSSLIEIDKDELIKRYLDNPITKAIVFGGLEPFDTEMDLMSFIDALRNRYKCEDDVVIYTGYTEDELEKGIRFGVNKSTASTEKSIYNNLKKYKNIIVKFGRFIPGDEPHKDCVLGVNLISNNQYAKIISEN